MYYNDDIKREFISEMSDVNMNFEQVMNAIFNITKPYEIELDKDVCNFTIGEIIIMYKGICTFSMERLMVITSNLKRYTRWCIGRVMVIDGQNHFEELNNEIIKTCVNTSKRDELIITREELLENVAMLTNPSDRFISLACFEGLNDASLDMLNLEWKDFDEENYICHLPGRDLQVSKELIAAAKQSADTYEYISYSIENPRVVRYDSGDLRCIKKTTNTSEIETKTRRKRNLSNKFVRIKNFLGNDKFQVYALRDSGRIDMIQRLMQLNGTTAEETISENKEIIEKYYGAIPSVSRFMLKNHSYFGE